MVSDNKVITGQFGKKKEPTKEEMVRGLVSPELNSLLDYVKEKGSDFESLLVALTAAIESMSDVVDVNVLVHRTIIGYYLGLCSGLRSAIYEQRSVFNNSLSWLSRSVKNRFDLTDDDDLIIEINDLIRKENKEGI